MAPQNPDWSSDFDAIEAKRAPVAPRVSLYPGEASVPIDRQVRALLEKRVGGAVCLSGESGSGKTTALWHLAAEMGPDSKVMLMDRPLAGDRPALPPGHLLVYSSPPLKSSAKCVILKMSPWGDEDLIEYLLATHKDRCRSVMDRIKRSPDDVSALHGLPEMWRIVLDEMAADDGVVGGRMALMRFLERSLLTSDDWERAGRRCLHALVPWGNASLEEPICDPIVGRMMNRSPVQEMLAARQLARGLAGDTVYAELAGLLPRTLVAECGHLLHTFPEALPRLKSMASGDDSGVHAMAVSLLHAAGDAWRPAKHAAIDLTNAMLTGAHWPGVLLAGAQMTAVELSHAVLDKSDFSAAVFERAALLKASLREANLTSARFGGANLQGADFGWAQLPWANFPNTDLTEAEFHRAVLRKASFHGANLTRAAFVAADLSDADFRFSTLEETDFTGAKLDGARLTQLPLINAIFNGARLQRADLCGCNLEGMTTNADFSGAKLDKSLLTGASFRGCSFRNASFRSCRMADIDLEGADLVNADFRGATFHMGSTRSGLVTSDVPCEGSRTGFYTDDFQDRDFKDPREIRKANLCNTDLRGAEIDKVDFYLVDLRGARYSKKQRDWFRLCRAILDG